MSQPLSLAFQHSKQLAYMPNTFLSLVYPGTFGASFMDYIATERQTSPFSLAAQIKNLKVPGAVCSRAPITPWPPISRASRSRGAA